VIRMRRPGLQLAALALLLPLAACSTARAGGRQQAVTLTPQVSGTEALLIAVSPVSDDVVWVSGQGGTWLRTLDGGAHWQVGQVPGADSLQFRDVHALSADTAWLLSIGNGAQSRIYRTNDGGVSWRLQFTNPEPEGFYDCFDFWDARRGLAIGDAIAGGMALLRTGDGGTTWRRVPPDSLPPAQEGEGSFAASGTCLATRPGGQAWAVMSNPQHARLLHTHDYGRTWSMDTLPITVRSGSGPQSVSFRDDRHGLVLGGGYQSQPGDTLAVRTVDGGASWQVVTRPPLPRGVWGGSYVPGAIPSTMVAVGPDGIVYSGDDGRSWIRLDSLNYWSVGFASARAGWAVGQGGRITRLAASPPLR